MTGNGTIRVLLVVVALLTGVIVGQVAGILAVVSGSSIADAFVAGGVAFGGTVTLALLIQTALGQLRS